MRKLFIIDVLFCCHLTWMASKADCNWCKVTDETNQTSSLVLVVSEVGEAATNGTITPDF